MASADDLAPATDSDAIFAATLGGVFRTADSEQNWQRLFGGPRSARHVEVNSSTVFAAGANIMKSSDTGTTWSVISPDLTLAFATAPSNPAVSYAAFTQRLMKTTDGGAMWRTVSVFAYGYYYYGLGDSDVLDIEIDPHDEATAYIATRVGGFKTTNGGASWQEIFDPVGVRDMAIAPSNPEVVYAGHDQGMIRSEDGGTSWSGGGLAGEQVISLVVDPTNEFALYAGTADGEVYFSDTGGGAWLMVGNRLTKAPVLALILNRSRTTLYAGTAGGVFAYTFVDQ